MAAEWHGYAPLVDVDTFVALERAGWESLCAGTGSNHYGEVMTPDGVMVLANGQTMDRDEVVAALRDAPPWSSYEIASPQLLRLGPDAVALTYVGTGHRDGSPPFAATMTSAYVRVPDGDPAAWRLAFYQQTPVLEDES